MAQKTNEQSLDKSGQPRSEEGRRNTTKPEVHMHQRYQCTTRRTKSLVPETKQGSKTKLGLETNARLADKLARNAERVTYNMKNKRNVPRVRECKNKSLVQAGQRNEKLGTTRIRINDINIWGTDTSRERRQTMR